MHLLSPAGTEDSTANAVTAERGRIDGVGEGDERVGERWQLR